MATLVNHTATISTATVTIRTLTVGAKQVTLSLFRQMPFCDDDIIDEESKCLRGRVWGYVNYFWDPYKAGNGKHYVVEIDGTLHRMQFEIPQRFLAEEYAAKYRSETYDLCTKMLDLADNLRDAGLNDCEIIRGLAWQLRFHKKDCSECSEQIALAKNEMVSCNNTIMEHRNELHSVPQLYIAV